MIGLGTWPYKTALGDRTNAAFLAGLSGRGSPLPGYPRVAWVVGRGYFFEVPMSFHPSPGLYQ